MFPICPHQPPSCICLKTVVAGVAQPLESRVERPEWSSHNILLSNRAFAFDEVGFRN
jgi:hypothetical protein